MLAFLWVVFCLNFIGGVLRFAHLKSKLNVRTEVGGILFSWGLAGWALYFIIMGY